MLTILKEILPYLGIQLTQGWRTLIQLWACKRSGPPHPCSWLLLCKCQNLQHRPLWYPVKKSWLQWWSKWYQKIQSIIISIVKCFRSPMHIIKVPKKAKNKNISQLHSGIHACMHTHIHTCICTPKSNFSTRSCSQVYFDHVTIVNSRTGTILRLIIKSMNAIFC